MLKCQVILLFIIGGGFLTEGRAQENVQTKHVYMIRIATLHHRTILQTGFRSEGRKGVITALHGVANGTAFSAFNENGDILNKLRIVSVDINNDLALLQSSETDERPADGLKLAAKSNPIPGEDLHVFGHPQGINLYIKYVRAGFPVEKKLHMLIPPASSAAFGKRKSPAASIRVINIQGNLVPGDSGAPVLNSQNEVIGIVNGGLLGGAAAISWAIPIDSIQWRDVLSAKPELDELARLDSTDLFALTEETTDSTGANPDKIKLLEDELAQYARDLKSLPVVANYYRGQLERIADEFKKNGELEKTHPRLAATAYRLYAASIMLEPQGKNSDPLRPLDFGYPWLKESIALFPLFGDLQQLKSAEKFFHDILTKNPESVLLSDLLKHEFRVAMVEATDAEVRYQVEQAEEIVKACIRNPALCQQQLGTSGNRSDVRSSASATRPANAPDRVSRAEAVLDEVNSAALQVGFSWGSKVVLALLPIGRRDKPLSGINYSDKETETLLNRLGFDKDDLKRLIANVQTAMRNPNPVTATSLVLEEINTAKDFLNSRKSPRLMSLFRIGITIGFLLENSLYVIDQYNPTPAQMSQLAAVDRKWKTNLSTDILIAQLPEDLTDRLNKANLQVHDIEGLRAQIEACRAVLQMVRTTATNQRESQKHESKETYQIVVFLAGALLGDNVTWAIAQKPVSSEKKKLFEKCAEKLGISHGSSFLTEASAKDSLSLAASDRAMRAVLQFESAVRSVRGKELAELVRLAGAITMTIGTAKSLEFALSTNRIHEPVANVFRLSVLGLKQMGQTMSLPRKIAAALKSLPDYRGDMSDAIVTRNALISVSEEYSVGPLTEMTLQGGSVLFADADLTRFWALLKR